MADGSVRSAGGPAVAGTSNGAQEEVATVQKGETTLAQVSDRLGYGEAELRQANPQIKDPNKLKVGQDIHYPETHTNVKAGETNTAQVAKRLGVDEGALRRANPQIKDPNNLQVGQKIQNPEYYRSDNNSDPRSIATPTKPRKKEPGSAEERDLNISDKGVDKKVKGGKVNVAPGGDIEYTPSKKIGPFQPSVPITDFIPGIPKKGTPTPDPTAASRQQDDYKRMDPKDKEKLDRQQAAPGQKVTDREIKKGLDDANGVSKQKNIDQEFEARKAIERMKHPIPQGTLKMR